MAYHHRRERSNWGRHGTLEMAVTAVVIALVILLVVVFLFVYHDFPLRVS
jgi:heme/copper-type cytochrome/quinol oxidase subunit 2